MPMFVLLVVIVAVDVSHIYSMYTDVINELTTSEWRLYLLKTVLISLGGLALAAILLSIVAKYLSRKITKPVEESIAKQNRFIADASHELKTPVSVINANIAVLENQYGENKWMKYIKEEGHSMTLLINQLLNLSRLDYEAGRENIENKETEQFELVETLTETTLPFDSIAYEKRAVINIECDREVIAPGNRNDFKEIISILVDNAIKHTNEGGEITVSSNNAKGITAAVSNTGDKINPHDLPYLFDRFYKGSHSDDKDGYNFGLGLSIAKALADKNGYDISVTSDNEKTTFLVSLK